MRYFTKLLETKTLFAVVLASMLISSLAQRYLHAAPMASDFDFHNYYFAAQVLHDNPHANIYQGATDVNLEIFPVPPADSPLATYARAAGFDEINYYTCPPLLADLLTPLSRLPPNRAAVVWRAFNLTLVLASVLLLARMLRVPIVSCEFAVLALAAYSFWPIHEAIFEGQIMIVMLVLWTIGIVAYFEDRMVLSAAAFALATAFKITPILLVPLFFLWKERRWLVSFVATSLGLGAAMVAVNGPQTVSRYLTVMSKLGVGTPLMENKSLSSLVAWAYYGKSFPSFASAQEVMANPPHAPLILAKVVSGAFYLFCLLLVWRNRRWLNRESKASIIAVFGLVTACVSPISWRHGYSVAFIVLAVFWVRALRAQPLRFRTALLALTTFTLGSRFFDLAARAPLPEFCKILLAATWVVFSVLLSLDGLYYANADGQYDATRGKPISALGSARLEGAEPQNTLG